LRDVPFKAHNISGGLASIRPVDRMIGYRGITLGVVIEVAVIAKLLLRQLFCPLQ